jgi:hypothetical protein
MNRLGHCQVYVSHIQHVTEKSSFYIIYKSSVSPGFVKQTMSILLTLRYNDSLVAWMTNLKSKSKLCYDRRSVGHRPVCLGVQSPSGVQDQIFSTVRQFRVCCCGASSLTRGRVCRSRQLPVLARAVILGSESRGTHDHILLSQIRDSPNMEGQVPVFVSSRNTVVQLYPQALGSLFVASYDSQDYSGGIRTLLHAGND